jgi:hypothetical protein
MKKMLLGFVAAAALLAFTAPARAEGEAPAGDKPADTGAKKEKKAKKAKKGDKAEGGDAAGGAPAEKK